MKVKELIAELEKMDRKGEMLVVLSGDAEGNKFSPLYDISIGNYVQYNDCLGEVVGYRGKESNPCVVLYPIN